MKHSLQEPGGVQLTALQTLLQRTRLWVIIGKQWPVFAVGHEAFLRRGGEEERRRGGEEENPELNLGESRSVTGAPLITASLH